MAGAPRRGRGPLTLLAGQGGEGVLLLGGCSSSSSSSCGSSSSSCCGFCYVTSSCYGFYSYYLGSYYCFFCHCLSSGLYQGYGCSSGPDPCRQILDGHHIFPAHPR